jgi:hypothetical protein
MRREWVARLTALAIILSAASTVQAAEWGSLAGRMVVDGTVPPPATIAAAGVNVVDESVVVGPDNGLKNVFVYLRTNGVEVSPRCAANANDTVALDINHGRLSPHAFVLRTSQSLKVTNSDASSINVKLTPLLNPTWNPLLPAGSSATASLAIQETLPTRVDSNIQPWLRGWILVRDNPYAAVSASDGTFMIRDLPVGSELEFQLWQERAGYLRDVAFRGGSSDRKGRFRITVKAGDNDLGDLKVPAGLLR